MSQSKRTPEEWSSLGDKLQESIAVLSSAAISGLGAFSLLKEIEANPECPKEIREKISQFLLDEAKKETEGT